MRVTTLRIEKFRGIKRLDLDLDELTVLIGEDNTGKILVLDDSRVLSPGYGVRAWPRRTYDGAAKENMAERRCLESPAISRRDGVDTEGGR